MRLTIVICTHNRTALLGRTLRYLNESRRPTRCDVDIVVVANGCTDGTHDLLMRYMNARDGLPLRWQVEPTPGKSHALNRALPLIQADWAAFVDDDHRVDASYLQSIVEATRAHPEADIFCGRILPDWDGTEPAWVHDTGAYRIYPLPVPRYDLGDVPNASPQDIAIPGGGNIIVRGSLLAKVGRFSTDLGPVAGSLGGAEDYDWVERAIASGARLQYVPGIVQYHYADPDRLTTRYVVEKAYERSASVVRVSAANTGDARVPRYMVRKVARHLYLLAFGAFDPTKRRFHLVRLAASAGEVKGRLQAQLDLKRSASRSR